MTYNINKSRDWLFKESSRQKIKELILEVDADVVFFQEFSGDMKFKSTDHELESFADEIWSHFAYGKNSVYEEKHHGNVILSKYPILSWKNIDISTNRFEKRGMLCVRLIIPIEEKNQYVDLYCVHLDLSQLGRNRQISKIIKEVSTTSARVPYIIAGDFNDWNLKLDKKINKSLDVVECNAVMNNNKLVNTFPSFFPFLALDRVYVSGFFPDRSYKYKAARKLLLSDHLPVVTQVTLDR